MSLFLFFFFHSNVYLKRALKSHMYDSVADVATDVGVPYASLWNWYNVGTRIIHACAGGESFATICILDLF